VREISEAAGVRVAGETINVQKAVGFSKLEKIYPIV
jgi:hypothetical protein